MWANFHTHSTYCDGKSTLAETFAEARNAGLISIGFSSHAPLPFERPWAMKRERFGEYLSEVNSLKATNPPEVYAGLEVDFVPGAVGPSWFRERLDYMIGSVHFVDAFDDGTPWEIDNTNLVFRDGLKKIFRSDAKAAVSRYYELTREMILTDPPDIVGHMDKIKMQNSAEVIFSEDDSWYRDEIRMTIDALKKSGCTVDVNTRGIYQKKSNTTYPSPWIIEMLCEQNIPVTLSSDAHHSKDLINTFTEAAIILSKCGYKTIQVLHEGQWQPYRFNERGIIF